MFCLFSYQFNLFSFSHNVLLPN